MDLAWKPTGAPLNGGAGFIARWRTKFYRNRWFIAVVIAPVVLAALYYALIASPEYVSESRFVIKSPGQRPSAVTSIASLLQTTSMSAGGEQAGEVVDFITSRSAVSALNADGALTNAYGRRGADFLSRYPAFLRNPSNESLFRYYSKMVNVERERDTGSVVLQTIAFSPADAQAINLKLLSLSQDVVNRLNEAALRHQVDEAEHRVAFAEQRAAKALSALSAYRSSYDVLDPTKQAGGALDIAARLISERAALQAQLQITRQTAPRNPAIPALTARIAALDAQIDAQNGRAVGSPGAFASKTSEFEKLDLERQFSAQNLTAASAALEAARAEAVHQQFYLERVVEPDRPDKAELPHGWRAVLTLAGILLCVYFIGWMFIVGIIEHASDE